MGFQDVAGLLREVDARHVLLLCHHNADPDALCSAYAFSLLLKRIQQKLRVEIAAPGVSRLSKEIVKQILVRLVDSPRIEEADAIFLLDTNTLQQLEEWGPRVEGSGKPLVLIDHHAAHPQTERLSTVSITDERASSTCEIVFKLFQQAGLKLRRREALALFLGIAYDTRHFAIATSTALKIVAELVEAGVKVEEALPMLAMPMDASERAARLKGAARMSMVKMGEWLVAFSSVSSYQASVARALVGLGAHVAVVGGERKGVVKISMRATRSFHEETGVHLGRDVANPLGAHLHGMGGGHSTSAGVNGEGDLEEAFRECAKLLSGKLSANS